MIEIRNGCKLIGKSVSSTDNMWLYEDAKSTGIIRTGFTAPEGIIPKIGDFIDEDTFQWVQRTEPKIVPDLVNKYPDDDYELTFRR